MYHYETYQLGAAENMWDSIKRDISRDKNRYLKLVKDANFFKLQRAWIIGSPFLVVVMAGIDSTELKAVAFVTQMPDFKTFIRMSTLCFCADVDAVNAGINKLFNISLSPSILPDIDDETYNHWRSLHDEFNNKKRLMFENYVDARLGK